MRARHLLPIVFLIAAGCSSNISDVECTSNDDCAPGLVCLGGDCKRPGDTGDGGVDAGDVGEDPTNDPGGDPATDPGNDPAVDADTGDAGEDPSTDPGTDPGTDPSGDPDPGADADADTPPPAVCGDGDVAGDEACDDGDDNNDIRGGACRTDCTLPFCGDDINDPGEECDGGELNSDTEPNTCRSDCTQPRCGDGVIDDEAPWSEECDGDDNCDETCRLMPTEALCLNDRDGAAFLIEPGESEGWDTFQIECRGDCDGFGGSDDPDEAAACMASCMQDALGLSDACASCWSTGTLELYAVCPACSDPSDEACRTCIEDNPDLANVDTCTGAPWDADEMEGCQFHGEPCDQPGQYVSPRYWCNPFTGTCAAACATGGTLVADAEQTCPVGSLCFGAGEPPGPDPETGRVAVGPCLDSNCAFDTTGAEVCDGVVNLFDGIVCSDGSCACRPFGAGAFYCTQEGGAEPTDACERNEDCVDGSLCARGLCVPVCDAEDDAACDDEPASATCADPSDCTCQPLFGDEAAGPGECSTPCDDYADGGCPLGTACAPTWDDERIVRWYCAGSTVDEPAAIGETCDIDIGNVGACESGGICVSLEGDEPVCSRVCNPDAEGREPGSADRVCEEGEDCWPSNIDGLGICREACEPFPRRGRNGYDCEVTGTTCAPYNPDPTDVYVVRGVCDVDNDGVPPGTECDMPGAFDPCTDGALCAFADDSSEEDLDRVATCRAQCDPFAEEACDEGVCSGSWATIPGLIGGMCSVRFNDAAMFEPCETPGLPCADDGTLCLGNDEGDGGTCTRVCRVGGEDCLRWGATCVQASRTDGTPTREGIGLCGGGFAE